MFTLYTNAVAEGLVVLQSVEAVCRGVVEQAAAAAETAQKDCAAWKAKYEAALDRCNQQEFKVSMTISHATALSCQKKTTLQLCFCTCLPDQAHPCTACNMCTGHQATTLTG